ncbi:MAG: inosine/xanthosine triphosphatase [bacterium]
MKKVIIASGSKNPVKMECTRLGFEKMFPNEEFIYDITPVPSGVSDQPMSDEETLLGAKNRAINARNAILDADYWVGIEGGVSDNGDEMTAFAWIVIVSKNMIGKSRTSTFILPQKIAELIRGGMELGYADDLIFKKDNSKQKEGAVGILTDGVLDRIHYYEPSVILALIPFKNDSLY